MGKSTAVERFLEGTAVPHVYVTGVYQATSRQQLAAAAQAVRESRQPLPSGEGLFPERPLSWRDWLARLSVAAANEPIVVVLDEFPWLTAQDPSLEGELQAQWDRVLSRLPVLLILIGSDVTMMSRLATHDRPLFGRLRQLVVPALDPGEVAEALPTWPAARVIDAALVTGGYPRLLADLADSGAPTIEDYVRASLTEDLSPLVATGRLTLDSEFPDAASAYRVLSTIGADEKARLGFTDIVVSMADDADNNVARTATTRALRILTDDKQLIVREAPAWTDSTSRLRRYRLTDPYLRFWFRYVERQVEAIRRGRADLAISRFDRDWSSWRGRAVEPLVRTAVDRLAPREPRLAGVEAVDAWWTRDGQTEIDLVARDARATSYLGTIKWRASGVTRRDVAALDQARALVPRSRDAKLLAVAADGEAPAGADLFLTAGDLLEAWR